MSAERVTAFQTALASKIENVGVVRHIRRAVPRRKTSTSDLHYLPYTAMPETSIPPPATPARPNKPVSEALLNEKWDRCLSSLLIRSSLGLSFGVVFSVLLFKRRAWPAFVGLGFGAGRAYEECNSSFLRMNREKVLQS